MTKEFYFEFPYGSLFYGKESPPGIVPQVQNLYAIREPDYYILKWTAPKFDAAGKPVIPQSYIIYRTTYVNKQNSVELAIVNSVDINGNIDTCYIDYIPDTTQDYYYSVVTVNQAGYPSIPTVWVTDYQLPGISKYHYTSLYTSQKLNYFYNLLTTLTRYDVFDTEANVIPVKNITAVEGGSYVPANDYLYVDFFPITTKTVTFDYTTATVLCASHGLVNTATVILSNTGGALPAGLNPGAVYYVVNATTNTFQLSLTSGGSTVSFSDNGSGTSSFTIYDQILEIYLNGTSIASAYNGSNPDVPVFYAVLPYLPQKQKFTLEVRSKGGVTTYRKREYTSYDYLIYPAATAQTLNDCREDIEILKNNIWKDTCSLDLIYQNFGSFFNFPQPRYFATADYKDTVVGNEITSKPGLISAGLDGGSIQGIKEAITSITGAVPDVSFYRDQLGWVVRATKLQPIKKMCIIGMPADDPIRAAVLNGGFYPGSWEG